MALRERGWRVVAHDGPGHGSSFGRTSSLVEIARGAAATARAVGGVDAVIAHSLGAAAAVLAVPIAVDAAALEMTSVNSPVTK